jgi:hypothetical protein
MGTYLWPILGSSRGGVGATFSSTAMKKPPVSCRVTMMRGTQHSEEQ